MRPASATTTVGAQGEPGGPARLVDQSWFVDADGVFTATIALGDITIDRSSSDPADPAADDGSGGAPTVSVTVYSVIDDPAGLDADPEEPINRLEPRPLRATDLDGEGRLTVRVPIRDGEPFDGEERIRLPDPGVYPLVVDLSDGDRSLASVRTNLIRLPADDQDAGPIPVTVVLDVSAEAGSGLSVAEAVAVLSAHPDVPVTTVLSRDAMDQLVVDPMSAGALAGALDGRAVIAPTRPELDPSTMSAIGQGELFRSAFDATVAAGAALGLDVMTDATPVRSFPTEAGAATMLAAGATTAIDVTSLGLAEPGSSGRLPGDQGWLRWIAADPDASAMLGRPAAGPAASVQRLLAALVLRPTGNGPAVIAASSSADRPAETLALLLDALTGPGPTELLSLSGAADRLAVTELPPAAFPAEELGRLSEPVGAAQQLLHTYEAFYVDGPNDPNVHRANLRAALAVGQSPEARDRLIETTVQALDDALTVISLPENQAVNVAARSVAIPLTIANDSAGTRQVMLRFRSDKIVVAEEGQLITVGPGTSSIDIELQTRSLGVSPLQVSVLTPDGQRVLATTRFEVRSTAVPGLGLLISALGLGLLAVWWYLSIRRRRGGHPSRSSPPGDDDSDRESVERDRTLASDSV